MNIDDKNSNRIEKYFENNRVEQNICGKEFPR